MCGLVGILEFGNANPGRREGIVHRMADTLSHRGPDGEGYASLGPCTLGFRRLAIIDVAAPAPPFMNEDGTVMSVCNGQIYNSVEVAGSLASRGHSFRTRVDTEVIPHLYEEYGPALVDHLNGMFTAAVWDDRQRQLFLGRDRAGEKPLFYWMDDRELVFGSELRSLLAHPRVPRRLDPLALQRYLAHDYFPAPLTPFAGIRKLPAGHTLMVRDGRVQQRRYWDLADHFDQPALAARSRQSLVEELDERLATAVRRRRRSDVPVGLFLSGGIDSSTLLAYATEQAGPGVPVFSIGHRDAAFDESRFARETARHFKADFHALILGEAELEEGLRRVGAGFDEPLGDASTIPSHLLARFARDHVKVVLAGEGADELFAGYPTYPGDRVAEWFARLPRPVRRLLARGARGLAPVSMSNVGPDYLLERFLAGAGADRLARHHRWFGSFAPEAVRAILAPPLAEAIRDASPYHLNVPAGRLPDALAELLYTDFTMYLQDDLLTKVDRASMLASLEARAPFLDHELAAFVAGIPSRHKLSGWTTKQILRDTVRRRLPRAVLQRRKRGFNIPFSRWLIHGLGEQLRERFSRERVEARGLFRHEQIRALLDEHLALRHDHRKPLFTLLSLDLWCDRTFGDGAAVPVALDVAARAGA